MKSKEQKPMSLKKKILSVVLKTLLALLAVIVVAITVFAVMFWDTFVNIVKNPAVIPYMIQNWGAFSRGLSVSTEDLEAERKANTEAQAKAFADANINLTVEDIEKLSDGNMTDEERTMIIYNAMIANNGTLPGDTVETVKDTVNNGESVAENTESENSANAEGAAKGEEQQEPAEEKESVPDPSEKETETAENSPEKPTEQNKPAASEEKPDGKADDKKENGKTESPDATKPVGNSGQSGSPAKPEGNGSNTGTSEEPVLNKPLPNLTPPSTQNSNSSSNTKPQTGNSSSASKPQTSKPSQGGSSGKMTEEQYNMKVAELVARMYSIKADFVSQLSSFESGVIAEYKALPASQRTAATKSKIVSDNMNYIMGLEAQCDAQVAEVTTELTALMTANGKPTTLVDQINAAYVSEKETKKAYYVSLYS